MIDENSTEFFNSRMTVDYSNVKNLSPAQKDKIRHYGSQAEELLKNKTFAMFVHHFKFEVSDALSSIAGHDQDSNSRRVALSNQLTGIEGFIQVLKKAKYLKSRVVTQQSAEEPDTI